VRTLCRGNLRAGSAEVFENVLIGVLPHESAVDDDRRKRPYAESRNLFNRARYGRRLRHGTFESKLNLLHRFEDGAKEQQEDGKLVFVVGIDLLLGGVSGAIHQKHIFPFSDDEGEIQRVGGETIVNVNSQ
jgi:hypothetical protein